MEKIKEWLSGLGIDFANKLLPALLVIVIGIIVIKIVMACVNKALERSKLEKAAHSLIRSAVKIVLYGILVVIVASALQVTGIIALASVASLALSLALQNSLTNLIGGFTLLYTHPFKSGDYVEVAGKGGMVKEIGMAYTLLLTPDNKLISIPNSAVVAAEIVNYSCTGTRRVDINVSAGYTAPMDKVLEALREAAAVPAALPDPAVFAAVLSYDDNAIAYTLRVWCKTEDYWDVMFEVQKRIKEIFDREGIEMTYPNLNVYMQK